MMPFSQPVQDLQLPYLFLSFQRQTASTVTISESSITIATLTTAAVAAAAGGSTVGVVAVVKEPRSSWKVAQWSVCLHKCNCIKNVGFIDLYIEKRSIEHKNIVQHS